MPKVFISYSHDTSEHKNWVLQVSEQLRTGGLECQIDQYVHGFPSEGWPLWMEKQIEHADFVLVICSELYLQRFRREDPDGGRGVTFEGVIITQTIYDHYCYNKKFIPVIPADSSLDHVPLILKSFSAYHLPDDYELLYRLLTNQPAVVPVSVGSIKAMPPENAPSGIAPATPEQPAPPPAAPSASYDPRNPAFLIPFRQKGKYMVGREQELEKVREQLLEGKPTSIGQTALFQGMGGLGKTQLAVEYAYQYRDTYPNGVYWITADENIDAQLTRIAVDAHWVAPASEHAIKLDIARHRIRSYSDCLIVFDNLGTADAIRDYLPESSANPHILVTSRNEQAEFTDIKLDLLDDTQSHAMLVQESRRELTTQEEETAAHEIAAMLGGLPLALELAGAYLEHRPIGWCAYRDLLHSNLQQALPTKLASLTKHEADLFKTLSISEKELDTEPLLSQVLNLLTWSGALPMGLALMANLLDVQEIQLHGALSLGLALRLLQQTPGSERYAIHRLVQKVRRQEQPIEQHKEWADAITQRLGDWFEAIRKDFRELPTFELEFDHLRAWQAHTEATSPFSSIRLLWLQAYPAYHRGHNNEALDIVRRALDIYIDMDFKLTPLKANLLDDLAYCFARLEDYHNAIKIGKQSLKSRRELFGDIHPDVAISLTDLSSDYAQIGEYPHALKLGQQALDILCKHFGNKHPDIATSLTSLSKCYAGYGNYSSAFKFEQKALEMRRELFGEKHPDVARSLYNLAILNFEFGNRSNAMDFSQRALEMRRELLGVNHPDTIKSLRFVVERLN